MPSLDDIRPPIISNRSGSLHPITSTLESILRLLEKKGFEITEGPEIESEEYNFDMLNIDKLHPARQMHDTFYTDNKKNVLRTHTSPVQIRGMLSKELPLALITGGKVYRKDDDATHLPMFHQIEGIYIDKKVNFSHLKSLIYEIIEEIFGKKIKLRFRPSFFPFTEPSAEVDILFNGRDEWLEILGCGLVNPKVLNNCKINPERYSGLAFGLGVERIAMLKYGVKDIRDFYKSNLDFLEQFKWK